jgi:DNA-binding NarL/FixJ family response regulator
VSATARPRILLADDHEILVEGLKLLLAADFEVVGVVADGHALLAATRTLRPDVIVADIGMPGLGGIEATVRLLAEDPAVRVVILTMHREPAYARRALAAGARAFVLKASAPAELVAALREVLAGRTFVSGEIAAELQVTRPAGARTDSGLTRRQRDILQLLARGKTTKEVGAILGISARTVEAHKYDLMRATGTATNADLVRLAIRLGLIEP